jgi:hypothetical protein
MLQVINWLLNDDFTAIYDSNIKFLIDKLWFKNRLYSELIINLKNRINSFENTQRLCFARYFE